MDKNQAREHLLLLAMNPPKLVPVGDPTFEGLCTVSVFSPTTGHYQFASDWLPLEKALSLLVQETNNHVRYLTDLTKKS